MLSTVVVSKASTMIFGHGQTFYILLFLAQDISICMPIKPLTSLNTFYTLVQIE